MSCFDWCLKLGGGSAINAIVNCIHLKSVYSLVCWSSWTKIKQIQKSVQSEALILHSWLFCKYSQFCYFISLSFMVKYATELVDCLRIPSRGISRDIMRGLIWHNANSASCTVNGVLTSFQTLFIQQKHQWQICIVIIFNQHVLPEIWVLRIVI